MYIYNCSTKTFVMHDDIKGYTYMKPGQAFSFRKRSMGWVYYQKEEVAFYEPEECWKILGSVPGVVFRTSGQVLEIANRIEQ